MYPNICGHENKQEYADGINDVLVRRNNKNRDALLSNCGQTDYLLKLKRNCL